MNPAAIPILAPLLAYFSERRRESRLSETPTGQVVYGWPDGARIERVRSELDLELDECVLEQGIHVDLGPGSNTRLFSYRDALGPLAVILTWQDLVSGELILLDIRGNPDEGVSEDVLDRISDFVLELKRAKEVANTGPGVCVEVSEQLTEKGAWVVSIPEAFSS